MAIIKVANTLFSTTKTIDRALKKSTANDEIHVAPAHYTETLHFNKSVNIIGQHKENVIVEGTIIIPSGSTVLFQDITIMPTAHIHIEGTVHFENCLFKGNQSNAIMSLTNAHVTLKNCQLENAKDIAIAAFKHSHVVLDNCAFKNNGKTHILLDQSSGSFTLCKFSRSTHALWLKNDASLTCKGNQLMSQHGTQIIVQQSTYKDSNSLIKDSAGNGLFASKQAYVELVDCVFEQHILPQIWVQESEIHCTRTYIENGQESGMMIRTNSTAYLKLCKIAHHKIANIQLCQQSRLNLLQTSIETSEGIGIQIREQSIVNISNSIFAKNKLAQLFISDHSIVSISKSQIVEGQQVGLIIEKNSNCTLLESTISHHSNSGITVIDSECTAIDSTVHDNNGNGLLTLNGGTSLVENTLFIANKMPHLGAKNSSSITVQKCQFHEGKSVYIIEKSSVQMENCQLLDGDGVQIELNDHSKGTFIKCDIRNGQTNAMKFIRNSRAYITECIIAEHRLPQIVANDSSFIVNNSEIIDGERNGFIIENHAEAHIEETFIARHRYPQIWVDLHSNVELTSVQLTEGVESDLYLQNESRLVAIDSFIKNSKFTYNIQSINFSKIELQNTVIEHFSGDCFYTENNSEIISVTDDAPDREIK